MKNTQSEQPKKLLRNTSDKMVAGVASGIADYFDIDSNIIRLLFILLTIFGGSGILLYIVLWIFIPSDASKNVNGRDTMRENVREMKDTVSEVAKELKSHPKEKKEKSQLGFGIIIVIIGVLFLLNNLGIFEMVEIQKFWPLLLIFLGIHIVSRNEE